MTFDNAATAEALGMTEPIEYRESAHGAAIFSPDEVFRYLLVRRWGEGEVLPVVGLNPSTATHEVDDPTIRRCVDFAKRWGYDGLAMLNLFAFRATDPKVLIARHKQGLDVVGPANGAVIKLYSSRDRDVLCAWGAHGSILQRGEKVAKQIEWYGANPICLGLTASGEPKHPLYIAAATKPERYRR